MIGSAEQSVHLEFWVSCPNLDQRWVLPWRFQIPKIFEIGPPKMEIWAKNRFGGLKLDKTEKWLWRSHFLTDLAENFRGWRVLEVLSIKISKIQIEVFSGPFLYKKPCFSANLWQSKNIFCYRSIFDFFKYIVVNV